MSSSGGKLGIWTNEYASGQFTVTSTIFPTLKSHIDEYKALVRNSEGSVEIIIILNVYGNYHVIIVFHFSRINKTNKKQKTPVCVQIVRRKNNSSLKESVVFFWGL